MRNTDDSAIAPHGGEGLLGLTRSAIVTGIAIPLMIAIAALWPKVGHSVAVFASPFATADKTLALITKAGGLMVGSTPLSNAVIARSEAPDFVSRLYAAGAYLVVDAVAGCTNEPVRMTATQKDQPA